MISNMLGWSLLEKTERSGERVFRGALQGGVVPHSVVGPWWFFLHLFICVWARPRYRATHWRAVLGTASRFLEAIAPLMKPWCAEGEVPTAANLNLYRGWKSCVGWHCDDEPLFGKCGDAKLIVSVSLGSFALFRWRRQSCSSDEGRSCRLDHGDILVMDGQCQDEFLHRTDPGREQEWISVTFRCGFGDFSSGIFGLGGPSTLGHPPLLNILGSRFSMLGVVDSWGSSFGG